MTTPLTADLVQAFIDCARALDEQEIEAGPRYLLVSPRVYRLMSRLNRRPPYAKRRGVRGRRLALKGRR